MTKPERMPRLHELRALEDTLREHRSTCRSDLRARALRLWWRVRRTARRPQVRKLAIGVGAAFAVVFLGCAGLWLRLAAGPIELNFLSPWLASAVEQNIGSRHKVAIAGTQIERDNSGRTAIRILDMQVRDADGAVVASAPKAEVSVSGAESAARAGACPAGEPGRRRIVGPHRGGRAGHDVRPAPRGGRWR